MKAHEFCFWLQGHFELGDTSGGLSSEKLEVVKRHLAMVFAHDIDKRDVMPQEAAQLGQIHAGIAPFKPFPFLPDLSKGGAMGAGTVCVGQGVGQDVLFRC